MKKALVNAVLLLTLLFGLFPSPAFASTSVQPTGAAVWCQCVTYIKNRYGLSGSVGYAKNMGPFLVARGWRQVYSPVAGAIVVFQPAFGLGSAGHVGVITTVESTNYNRSWHIRVRGSNQIAPYFTDYNCNNVADTWYKSYSKTWGGYYIQYYVR